MNPDACDGCTYNKYESDINEMVCTKFNASEDGECYEDKECKAKEDRDELTFEQELSLIESKSDK